MTTQFDLSTTHIPWPEVLGPAPWDAGPMSEQQALTHLAEAHRVSTWNLAIFGPADDLMKGLEFLYRKPVLFTPDEFGYQFDQTLELPRESGFRLPELPAIGEMNAATLLSSPNALSGRVTTVQEAVAMTRRFTNVIVDERNGGSNTRALWPLVSEFDNIYVIGRIPFETPLEFTWILGPRKGIQTLRRWYRRPESRIERVTAARAGLAQAGHWFAADTRAARRHVSRLKGQLFRELRKLSLVSVPYPSWSNYLLARVERGTREQVMAGLQERGISVYAPPQANLKQHIRITAVSAEATDALKQALIEINREI